jgi:hypothetical protein
LKRSEALSQLIGDVIGMANSGLPVDNIINVNKALERSEKLIRSCLLTTNDREEQLNSLLDLSKVLSINQSESEAIISTLTNALSLASPSSTQTDISFRIPTQFYLQLSKLTFNSGRLEESLSVAMRGVQAHTSSSSPSSPSLLLIIGVCSLRKGKWVDADDALMEANMIDNRFAEVWAFLCLNCLLSSKHRVVVAERALYQSLRLGLKNLALLREISTSFMNCNKLELAEDIIRRVISMEVRESDTGCGTSTSRYLLARILDKRNLVSAAIDEYRAVIGDLNAEKLIQLESAQRAIQLVESIGRNEDKATLGKIVADLTVSH